MKQTKKQNKKVFKGFNLPKPMKKGKEAHHSCCFAYKKKK